MAKQIFVIVGSYGAGKTEISLNMAITSARTGKRTALVDLDIVNPFFRSGFHGELLEKENVKLIASEYTLEASDVPVVSPEVNAAFDADFDTVIFDVGGDPVGATALGQYNAKFNKIPKENLHVLFLVNTRRPLTSSPEDIEEMLDKIQKVSRLSMTGLVNNSNLAGETDIDLLREGEEILGEVSRHTGIPITHYGIKKALYDSRSEYLKYNVSGKPILLDIYTRLDWLDYKSN